MTPTAQKALDGAKGSQTQAPGGPGPGNPGEAGPIQGSPPYSFHGKRGLYLVVPYLVHGDLRVPWAYPLWLGKGERTLSLLALRLLASLPPWLRRAFPLRVGAVWAARPFGVHRFRVLSLLA